MELTIDYFGKLYKIESSKNSLYSEKYDSFFKIMSKKPYILFNLPDFLLNF